MNISLFQFVCDGCASYLIESKRSSLNCLIVTDSQFQFKDMCENVNS